MEDPQLSIRWTTSVLDAVSRTRALRMLSGPERDRLTSEMAHRAEAFLAGRLLLRQLAGELLGLDPRDVPLVASCPDCAREHGRPQIEGSDLQVSLSHGGDAVVAVAIVGARVGVDIESTSASVAELAPLIRDPTVRRWTRIEAVLKADGRGLRIDPGEVVFTATELGEIAMVPGSSRRYLVSEVDAPGAARETTRRVSVAVEIV